MKEMITRINRTLFEIESGILIFGVFCQAFVIFVKDKTGYSVGLWLGILIAMSGAVHMWWSLDRGLDREERAAIKYISIHNILRYLIYAVAFTVIAVTEIGNPLTALLGVFSLKIGAYLQFLTKKISRLIYGEEILQELVEEPAREQDR